LNPPTGATLNVKVVVCPAAIVAEAGFDETEKSSPVPVSTAVCGLDEALSAKLRVALSIPDAEGLKTSATEQVLPGATVAPVQESDCIVKSEAFVPVMETVETVRLAEPELATITVCGALFVPTISPPKLRAVEESVAAAAVVPVPFSAVVCGLSGALSVTVTVAVLDPCAVGVKVIPTSHSPAPLRGVPMPHRLP
jgi:hypothetical protein